MVSICAALAALTARAEPVPEADREAIIARFVAQQDATETFQAELTQRLELRGLKRPAESTGQLYYRAPDALALHFTRPAGEFLIQTGRDSWRKKNHQPVVHQRDSNAHLLFLLFRRDGDVRTDFVFAMERDGDRLRVTLTPRQPDKFPHLVAIENTLAWPDLEIVSMRTVFEGGNVMQYDFANVRRNEPVPPAVFEVTR